MQWLILLLLMPIMVLAQPNRYTTTYVAEIPDRLERLENQLKNLPRDDFGRLESELSNIPRERCCDTVRKMESIVDRIGLEQSARTSRLVRLEQDTRDNTTALSVVQRTVLLSEAKIINTTNELESLRTKFWFLIGAIIIQVLANSPLMLRTVKHYRAKSNEGDDE